MSNDPIASPAPLRSATPTEQYVAFIDILGFGSQVITDFDSVLAVYQELVELHPTQLMQVEGVSTRVLSDSFVVISRTFGPLIPIIQGLQFLSFRDSI